MLGYLIGNPNPESNGYSTNVCNYGVNIGRGNIDINVAISGKHRSEVWVDIYAPGQENALSVLAQYNKKFTDTHEDYIHQAYSSYDLPVGYYVVKVKFQGKNYQWTQRLRENETAWFFVDCN